MCTVVLRCSGAETVELVKGLGNNEDLRAGTKLDVDWE